MCLLQPLVDCDRGVMVLTFPGGLLSSKGFGLCNKIRTNCSLRFTEERGHSSVT